MLRRFKSWRRRTQLAVVLVAALVFASAALAGWVIFTGGQGTVQGSFGSATATNPALTITDLGGGAPVAGPNSPGTVKLTVNNVNPSNVAETITGETDTFTSSPADCASHLSVQTSPLVGTFIPAGGSSGTAIITVVADGSLPNDCPNATFALHVNLTSNP
jgi:hypothetical protein